MYQITPEAIVAREDGYLELNVDPIHWAGINAIQELDKNQKMLTAMQSEIDSKQDREIASLKQKNSELEKRLEVLEKVILKLSK